MTRATPALSASIVVRRVRDLRIFDIGDRSVVVACDSSGGIGPKPADVHAASAADVAHFAMRVALVELLAAGAAPVLAVDALCVERDPTGEEMIAAARALLAELGLDPERALVGSTEDNVRTTSTGVGVTAIGVAPLGALYPGTSTAGDLAVCLGLPRSAPAFEVAPDLPEIVTLDEVRRARELDGVHDMLPVGSRGVRDELSDLAAEAGLRPVVADGCAVDLDCSGGPATCVLASCEPAAFDALRALRPELPVNVVGRLEAL